MKNLLNIRYIYLAFLTLFTILFINHKSQPRLSKLTQYQVESKTFSPNLKNKLLDVNSIDRRISVGETIAFKDKTYWYQVFLLSFWKEEYLNLKFLKKPLIDYDLQIKKVNDSNYASGTFNNETIVFACLKSPNNFYYDFKYGIVPRSSDLNYWKKVFIKNIKYIIYSFKPNDYHCLLVFTSNKNFFKDSEEGKRDLILKKFNYFSEKE